MSRAIPGIDHFKRLNEERFRAVGDAALRRIAQVAGAVRGPDDFLARLGGEAFVPLLPLWRGAGACARRWRDRPRPMSRGRPVTLGTGLAEAAAGPSPGTLMEVARTVRYRAKNAG